MADKKRILIIDDSEIVLALASQTLEGAGYDVATRSTPFGTGAAILRENPDLVLVDVTMPALSGEDVVQHIRKHQTLKHTMAFLYSDRPPVELEAIRDRCGADGYIHKTSDMVALVRNVAKAFASAPVEPRTAHPASQSEAKSTSLRVLFVDDDERSLRALARCFSRWTKNGYTTSPRDALQRLSSPECPDVVVTDVAMPEMSGQALLERAVEMDSAWRERFIFMTGLTQVSELLSGAASGTIPLLHKPLNVGELEQTISTVARRLGNDHSAAI